MLLTDCGIDQLEFWKNRISARLAKLCSVTRSMPRNPVK